MVVACDTGTGAWPLGKGSEETGMLEVFVRMSVAGVVMVVGVHVGKPGQSNTLSSRLALRSLPHKSRQRFCQSLSLIAGCV